MILCWGPFFCCSKRTANFHKVETGHQTLAGSVAKHTQISKLRPRGRDGDSTDGLISVTPPCNGPWVHLPTSGLQGATQIARDMGVALPSEVKEMAEQIAPSHICGTCLTPKKKQLNSKRLVAGHDNNSNSRTAVEARRQC